MNYEQYMIFIVIAVFFSYVGTVWAKFGVQPSISDSFYSWKGNWRHLFTFFCWGLALPIFIAEPIHWFFITAGGLGFVGTAAEIKKEFVSKVHNPSAVVAIISGLLGITFVFGHWYIALSGIVLSGLLALFNVKNKIWWVEIIAFISIISSFVIKHF